MRGTFVMVAASEHSHPPFNILNICSALWSLYADTANETPLPIQEKQCKMSAKHSRETYFYIKQNPQKFRCVTIKKVKNYVRITAGAKMLASLICFQFTTSNEK